MKRRSGLKCSLVIICLGFTGLLTLPASSSICPSPLPESSPTYFLSAAELRSLLIGNTASWSTCLGNIFHVYHAPNGSLKGKFKARYYDTGTWKISGSNEVCRTWNKWRESAVQCFRVYRTDSHLYGFKSDSDNFIGTVDIRSGDPERLAD